MDQGSDDWLTWRKLCVTGFNSEHGLKALRRQCKFQNTLGTLCIAGLNSLLILASYRIFDVAVSTVMTKRLVSNVKRVSGVA